MKIDAYTATVPADPMDVLEGLQAQLESDGYSQMVLRPFTSKFYDQGVQVRDSAGVLASLQFGGNNGAAPSLQVQGEPSVGVSGWLRSEFPSHRCSRIDASHDLAAPGLFDSLCPILVNIADDFRLGKQFIDERTGRTQYLGAMKSPRRMRLYEKGLELLARKAVTDADPNHLRLEMQYRPEHREQAEAAARLSPVEVFGISEWSRLALEHYCGTQAPEVNLRVHRERDDARARRYLCDQYGKTILAWLAESGSPEDLGVALVAQVREQRKNAAQRRNAA